MKHSFNLYITAIFICIGTISFAQEQGGDTTHVQPNDTVTKKSVADKILGLLDVKVGNTEMSIYPIISYAPSSGLSLGVMPLIVFPHKPGFEREHRESALSGSVTYSTNKWLEAHADTKIFTQKYDITIYLDLDILRERFYGIGLKGKTIDQGDNKDFSWYETKFLNIDGVITRTIKAPFSAGLTYDFNITKNADIENDSIFTPETPGEDGGVVMGIGPVVTMDTRDDVYYPSKGSFIKLYGKFCPALDHNDYQYWHFFLDVRKFFDLKKDWVIGLQSLNDYTSGNVPFYKMPKIAGNILLRGFEHRSKYVDQKMSYLQAEVRKWIWWRLGVAGFVGAGNVFRSGWGDLKDDMKYVGGLGMRFRLRDDSKINFRFDYGFASNGDSGFFLTIREAF